MTLITASTLSVSDFAALVDASRDDAFSPLSPCPRSASPELRGSPLRRFSGAPSSPRARMRTPPPQEYEYNALQRCCGSPSNTTRRGSASTEQSAYSSACSDDDDDDDDGIIWFGRRSPPCSVRTEQFRHWVEGAEPPRVSTSEKTRIKAAGARAGSAGGALWSKLFVLWRVRRRLRATTPATTSSSHRHLPAIKPNYTSLHRRMRTSPC